MKDGRTVTEQWLSGELTRARDERDTALARMIDAEDRLRQINGWNPGPVPEIPDMFHEIPDHLFQKLEEFLDTISELTLKDSDFISGDARRLAIELQKTRGGSK